MTFDTHQRFKSKKIQKAYDTVLKAHDKAIKKARSGMSAKEIDAIARGVIDKAGFGKYFVHSTGHGVGLDIHEMPYISTKSDTIIQDGMVYTIEPGIYIEGEFGIRIEDMVVMQNGKAVVL
jgi:Xaa-Pro aminopeptidase